MTNQIKLKYQHCDGDNCHQTLNDSFFVKDVDNEICEIVYDSSVATCHIQNDKNIPLNFFAVDECLIKGNAIRKCDFCVTDDNNIIVFVELKEIIFSGNRKKDRQKRSNYRKDAVEQIASTINDFISKGIDLSKITVEGVISFPPYVDESNPITIPSTISQARVSQFSNLCGFNSINEGNHIVF